MLTREKRGELSESILFQLSTLGVATAPEMAEVFQVSSSSIHSVLVSLRSQGLVEPYALVSRDNRVFLYSWGLSHHGYAHGDFNSGSGCVHCERRFEDWR